VARRSPLALGFKEITMTFAINLILLGLGTTGALAAFGGETWKKSDEPLYKRITRRGWLALVCMLATLALGIVKEIRSSAASAESAAQQGKLEDNLSQTTADLREARENLARVTTELSETRAKLAAVEPNILKAMVVATTGLRRETDFSTPSLTGQPVQALSSGRTNAPLVLYGGDLVDYHLFCTGTGHRIAGRPFLNSQARTRITLRVGNTDYPLSEHGRQMIIGPVGQPLQATIVNPDGVTDCQMKMLVESADRTREALQLEPLIKMINDARALVSSDK
jgi:hypothetical protein